MASFGGHVNVQLVISCCLWCILELLFCSHAYAFIYDVTELKKWDATRGRYQRILAYSDFHGEKTAFTQQTHNEQSAVIQQLLTKMHTSSTKVLVEDVCAANDRGCASCNNFCVRPSGGILAGLTKQRYAHGVPVCNVEFRFCRVTALAPVFQATHKDPASFESTNTITIGTLRDEILATMREIQAYTDNTRLQQLYRAGIAKIHKELSTFAFDRHQTLSVAQYLKMYVHGKNSMDRLKRLLIFDSELLDHKLLHHVAAAADTETIIIFAGGSHCAHVCEVLQRMGYVRVHNEPARHEYVGAGIPKPLNLAQVRF